MDSKRKNIEQAMKEPARLARHEGVLYYLCELGPIFAVGEGRLHDAWRSDVDLAHAGTFQVDLVPPTAVFFELGDAEQHDEGRVVDAGLLGSTLGAIDEAIEQWASWCDDQASLVARAA